MELRRHSKKLANGPKFFCGLRGRGGRVVEYRHFRNVDPPQLVRLWHASELGRGAAAAFTTDAFEHLVFCQPYFDHHGLVVALHHDEIVGAIHVGFGCLPDESALSKEIAVICLVMVHPEFRRQGIGRELVRRAEQYARASGAAMLQAGGSRHLDPFYHGLYGGSQVSGFLESDAAAKPFFESLGFQIHQRFYVYHRDLTQMADPFHLRLINIRRKTEIAVVDQPTNPSWWWFTRYGRLDLLQFQLTPKAGGDPVVEVTVVGLDWYMPRWNVRSVGLVDMYVPEPNRRMGYGQALLIDLCKRLVRENIVLAEAHVEADNDATIPLLESLGFTLNDKGNTFRRAIEPA